ncbi:MAG TPA: L-threonylcarbamoyladenylate synthase [Gammaproteobacteria bacterium]|nr:L-threonylcarbamoyladenylate synthase [Gammaproteobacteria bacterium]
MDEIDKAVHILRAGGLVAFPTETVYGLGADARNAAAVQKIFTVKERPLNHPLIVHVAAAEMLEEWASVIPDVAWVLAKAFWPGPLTLVLPKRADVLDVVTGGQQTVGLRIPRHTIALALLRKFGSGVVAPSANKFTHLSPTTAAAVAEELGEEIDLIMDGEACDVGLESTIVDVSTEVPVILRPGMITAKMIEEVLHQKVTRVQQPGRNVRVPGQHILHYAPRTPTEMLPLDLLKQRVQCLSAEALPVAVIVHSANFPELPGVKVLYLPRVALAYAHDLYHCLRSLDHGAYRLLLIETVPQEADWEAIQDRLVKASARL